MLSWLVSTSIQFRVILLALCGGLMVVGYQSIRKTPLDVFPEFAPPLIEVQTEAWPLHRRSRAWSPCR